MTSHSAPLVSVIIPTFNRARELVRCLDSVQAQTISNIEVFVCDDGSTDNTAIIVKNYARKLNIQYRWTENYGGPAWGRNWALSQAKADYIAFLDSDDWWLPQKLEHSLGPLKAGADLVFHALFISRQKPMPWDRKSLIQYKLTPPIYDNLIQHGNVIANSSVVTRRELLLKIGGFSEDPEVIAWEDYDAWLRIARSTDRFERINTILGYYSVGDNNISAEPEKAVARLMAFERKYLQGSQAPWFNYELGRALYRSGKQQLARPYLLAAVRNKISSRSKINAVKMLLGF